VYHGVAVDDAAAAAMAGGGYGYVNQVCGSGVVFRVQDLGRGV